MKRLTAVTPFCHMAEPPSQVRALMEKFSNREPPNKGRNLYLLLLSVTTERKTLILDSLQPLSSILKKPPESARKNDGKVFNPEMVN